MTPTPDMQPDNTKPHDPKPHNAKPLALVIAAAVMVAWCATSTAEPPALDRPADLILSGGHVKTSSGWTEAVAIRSGVIVALGDTKSITALSQRKVTANRLCAPRGPAMSSSCVCR